MSDDNQHYTFTVYTGTRNRAHTLHRPYDSLRSQTYRDFEWLIVDNDSNDGTTELVATWQAEADFPIRYIKHENRGHHGSSNRGVQEARGELFLTLDSDDGCVPDALERLKARWDEIPAEERGRFSAITALCVDENGKATGPPFPTDPTDSNPTELRYRFHVVGEKWGFQRVDVMRAHPYPTIPGYTGMMSGHLVWGEIGRTYLTRYINEYLGIIFLDQPDALTKGAPRDLARDAIGETLEARAVIDLHLRYFRYDPIGYYLKAAKYSRSAIWAGQSLREQGAALTHLASRLLWVAAIPVGFAVYVGERTGLTRLVPGRGRRGIAR